MGPCGLEQTVVEQAGSATAASKDLVSDFFVAF
jgi:hypothetical protein